jgi:hypothetical protein
LSLDEQRAIIRRVARSIEDEWDYRCTVQPARRVEGAGGATAEWPILKQMIGRVREDDAGRGVLPGVILVVPTLEGVRFNLAFLEQLAGHECGPIYIYASRRHYWRLYEPDDWRAFNEVIRRVRKRNGKLPEKIKAAIQQAKEAGKPTGAARPGSHRFTPGQLSKGGKVTAAKRRLAAEKTYQELVSLIREQKWENRSVGFIVRGLGRHRTHDDRKIGRTLIWRTLKRMKRENAPAQEPG